MPLGPDAYYIVNPIGHRMSERGVPPDPPEGWEVVADLRDPDLADDMWLCDGCNSPLDPRSPVPAFRSRAMCRGCAVRWFGYPDAWWDGTDTRLCRCGGCEVGWDFLVGSMPMPDLLDLFIKGPAPVPRGS